MDYEKNIYLDFRKAFMPKQMGLLLGDLTNARDAQRPMPHAFQSLQHIGKIADDRRISFDGDDLQAVVVVQMNVLGRLDHIMKIMLDINDPVQQVPLMMVVDVRYGARNFLVIRPFLLQQASEQSSRIS